MVAQFATGSTSSRAWLFLERQRQCKNTRVGKISKQKHLQEVITIKRKRFRQVKAMIPFPLNNMFHINYKIDEECLIYNQLQNSRGWRVLHRLQSSPIYNKLHNGRGVLAAKLANKKINAGGDDGFTVPLQQPLSQCAWRRW